jgi:Kef-type K+ transport system membrane component KefB
MAPESAVGAKAEEIVAHLLVQIIVILVVSRAVAALVRRVFGQTDVAGEILAGLMLGPSLLGAVAPGLMAELFHPSAAPIFVGLAQVGLVLLMFQIGLEFEIGSAISTSRRTIVAVSATGIALPFVLGYLAAPWFWNHLAEPRPSELGFRLFFATAMSITAIPVLGRIFMELGLSHTRTAALAIGAAAIDDVVGWLLLGVVSTIVTVGFAPGPFAVRVALLAAYLAVLFLIARRPLQHVVHARLARTGQLDGPTTALLLVAVFVSALITSKLGVFAIIGGFALGVALHKDRRFVAEWRSRVGLLVNGFFLPLFFAYTGVRTDIGSLDGSAAAIECAVICAIAFAGKFGGAYLAARLAGERRDTAAAIGVCMNTRALMELIALNVGYDLGVLPRRIFTMLVIMAIASTYIATPLIRALMSRERRVDPSGVPLPPPM